MPTVQHATLTDPNNHEPKGISTASSDSLYVANGSGSGTWKQRLRKLTATISPALVAANTTTEQTFTVNNVALATDYCIGVSKPTAQAGLGIVGWRVSADNTIGITFSNNTGAGITPTASQTYTFFVWRD
mgnify:CR=1 FL=1